MDARELETGFLAVPGSPETVGTWAAEGPEPVRLLPAAPQWTLVFPTPEAQAPPPFDHPSALLAGRPLPAALRPAFGFFTIGPRALVTLQSGRLICRTRWLVWQPGRGTQTLPKLPSLTAGHLAAAAGVAGPDVQSALQRILDGTDGTTERFLTRLAVTLHVPGAHYFADPGAVRAAPGVRLVTPSEVARRRFDDVTRHRAEVCAERQATQGEEL